MTLYLFGSIQTHADHDQMTSAASRGRRRRRQGRGSVNLTAEVFDEDHLQLSDQEAEYGANRNHEHLAGLLADA